VEVLNAFGESIPVFGMVKDDRHRTRALITPDGRETGIKNEPALFALIGSIQEEAHRFAIGLHRKKRGKSVTTSALDSISELEKKEGRSCWHISKVSTRSKRRIWSSLRQFCRSTLQGRGTNIFIQEKVNENNIRYLKREKAE
jgi:hypothetical protein